MRVKIIICYLLALNIAFMSFTYATDHELCENSILELKISNDGPTRITIAGEKINDIFVYPQELVIAELHSSGCLFILPQHDLVKDKVYVTLVIAVHLFIFKL